MKDFNIEKINFEKSGGLVPAIVQDVATRQVLMLAFCNRESLAQSVATGRATFFSRTRNKLWVKGETSGNFLPIRKILPDCDGDTVLFLVDAPKETCHLKQFSCFGDEIFSLQKLEKIIADRADKMPAGSHTATLFGQGTDRILQKFGEEAVEVLLAGKNENEKEFLGEAADLIFHFLVLLRCRKVSLRELEKFLQGRHQK